MAELIISKNCVFCGKKQEAKVDKKEYDRYCKGGLSIQEAIPTADVFTRDLILVGNCFDCESEMYNIPKPGEDWGESRGCCPICDCNLWEKDFTDNMAHCPSCKKAIPRDEVN